ncbi:MAG: type II secretion system F family protein [Candidatus Aenigmatarchaeota archaeon]
MKNKPNTMLKFILVPTAISIILIFIGILLGDVPILGNLIIISVFISIVPYVFYKYSKFLWIRGLEEQFPNFIRDLADSTRSGMSLPEAIGIASKANYGKLTPEVQKMHNRLSWGTPFLRVMDIFNESVKDSKIMCEALRIIKHSFETGGSIPDTLDAVSKDIIMLKEAEAERASLVRQQVMIMYGLFFIFLGIAVMIVYVMVPMLKSQAGMTAGISGMAFVFINPCENGPIFPCGLFSGICSILNVSEGITCYYVAIFFSVVVIQAIFTGLIAGQLSDNSATAGMKHSLIMVFAAVGVFLFFAKTGMFPS